MWLMLSVTLCSQAIKSVAFTVYNKYGQSVACQTFFEDLEMGSKFVFKDSLNFEENCDFLEPKNDIFANTFGTSCDFQKSAKKLKKNLNTFNP